MNKYMKIILNAICFVAAFCCIILGQRKVSYGSLLLQLLGIAVILGMLYLYNKKNA